MLKGLSAHLPGLSLERFDVATHVPGTQHDIQLAMSETFRGKGMTDMTSLVLMRDSSSLFLCHLGQCFAALACIACRICEAVMMLATHKIQRTMALVKHTKAARPCRQHHELHRSAVLQGHPIHMRERAAHPCVKVCHVSSTHLPLHPSCELPALWRAD